MPCTPAVNNVTLKSQPAYYVLLVERSQVKIFKNRLEDLQLLNQNVKIHPVAGEPDRLFIIPTIISPPNEHDFPVSDPATVKGSEVPHELADLGPAVMIMHYNSVGSKSSQGNTLFKTLTQILPKCDPVWKTQDWHLFQRLSCGYCIYLPMLLLCASRDTLEAFDNFLGHDHNNRTQCLSILAKKMGVTHIASNAPVPAEHNNKENVIRSPSRFQPIYGNFGPSLPHYPQHTPLTKDFEDAFWVLTIQNGIKQTWAPRYTMFSAGNVSEKTRILQMQSVRESVAIGKRSGNGSCAVDLFAGIGYFAFSYIKAGITNVLCWDLNPWSIEGLCRGAKTNKWSFDLFVSPTVPSSKSLHDIERVETARLPRLLVFNESNTNASGWLAALRSKLPPIRHVNCGMLPSSGMSWNTAIEAIDPEFGGWIHIHENVFESKKRDRIVEIAEEVNKHYYKLCDKEPCPGEPTPSIEHVEKVKSAGPRLEHIVVDMWIPPRPKI